MDSTKIAIIGLGYVGLPLARLFAEKYPVIGFDINEQRIQELRKGSDSTLEVADDMLQSVLSKNAKMKKGLFCTSNISDISDCTCYIITVPTPVDKNNLPK